MNSILKLYLIFNGFPLSNLLSYKRNIFDNVVQ